jgi:hypothetical protein
MVCDNYENCGNFASFENSIEYDEGQFIKTLIFCSSCYSTEIKKRDLLSNNGVQQLSI